MRIAARTAEPSARAKNSALALFCCPLEPGAVDVSAANHATRNRRKACMLGVAILGTISAGHRCTARPLTTSDPVRTRWLFRAVYRLAPLVRGSRGAREGAKYHAPRPSASTKFRRRTARRQGALTMQLAQLSSAALLLALTPFATFQTPAKPPAADGPKPEKAEQTKPKSAPQLEAERVRNDLLGAWQLVRFEMDGEVFSGATCRGYLLVAGEFLSLDLQVKSNYVRNLETQGQLFS